MSWPACTHSPSRATTRVTKPSAPVRSWARSGSQTTPSATVVAGSGSAPSSTKLVTSVPTASPRARQACAPSMGEAMLNRSARHAGRSSRNQAKPSAASAPSANAIEASQVDSQMPAMSL